MRGATAILVVALASALVAGCGGDDERESSGADAPAAVPVTPPPAQESLAPRVARFLERRGGPLNGAAEQLIGPPARKDPSRAQRASALERDATAAAAAMERFVADTTGEVRNVVVEGVIALELLARCGRRAADFFSRAGVRSPDKPAAGPAPPTPRAAPLRRHCPRHDPHPGGDWLRRSLRRGRLT